VAVAVPTGAFDAAVSVSVLVLPELGIVEGLNDAVTPLGNPETPSVTPSLNAALRTIDTVVVVDDPATRVADAGDTVIV
jgi:hypothetical protein